MSETYNDRANTLKNDAKEIDKKMDNLGKRSFTKEEKKQENESEKDFADRVSKKIIDKITSEKQGITESISKLGTDRAAIKEDMKKDIDITINGKKISGPQLEQLLREKGSDEEEKSLKEAGYDLVFQTMRQIPEAIRQLNEEAKIALRPLDAPENYENKDIAALFKKIEEVENGTAGEISPLLENIAKGTFGMTYYNQKDSDSGIRNLYKEKGNRLETSYNFGNIKPTYIDIIQSNGLKTKIETVTFTGNNTPILEGILNLVGKGKTNLNESISVTGKLRQNQVKQGGKDGAPETIVDRKDASFWVKYAGALPLGPDNNPLTPEDCLKRSLQAGIRDNDINSLKDFGVFYTTYVGYAFNKIKGMKGEVSLEGKSMGFNATKSEGQRYDNLVGLYTKRQNNIGKDAKYGSLTTTGGGSISRTAGEQYRTFEGSTAYTSPKFKINDNNVMTMNTYFNYKDTKNMTKDTKSIMKDFGIGLGYTGKIGGRGVEIGAGTKFSNADGSGKIDFGKPTIDASIKINLNKNPKR